jgi:hypothetical protein
MTLLCDIAYKYGSDRCPQINHPYTPFYYEILKDKRFEPWKILEIGIGYPSMQRRMKSHGIEHKIGAGLYMWRDFFPNAQIYGIDIVPEVVFQDDRIETFLCDQNNADELKKLIDNIGNLDLVIDDGCHGISSQVNTCKTIMPLIKREAIYIIEDVTQSRKIEVILRKEYESTIHRFPKRSRDNCIMIIKKRENN